MLKDDLTGSLESGSSGKRQVTLAPAELRATAARDSGAHCRWLPTRVLVCSSSPPLLVIRSDATDRHEQHAAGDSAIVTIPMGLGPTWYPIALIVLSLPCVWLGGKLRIK